MDCPDAVGLGESEALGRRRVAAARTLGRTSDAVRQEVHVAHLTYGLQAILTIN